MVKRLLAVDAPNLDMTVSNVFGRRATARERPDYDALLRWFRGRQVDGDAPGEAAVFLNIRMDAAEKVAPWVLWLTQTGYRVFCKPKIADSDIDDDIVDYLVAQPAEDLADIVLVSHDARAFLPVAEELGKAGAPVTVLGFAEYAGAFLRSEHVAFVDLSDVPDLFAVPLPPRVTLFNLPAEGRWFEPVGQRRPAAAPDTDELDLG